MSHRDQQLHVKAAEEKIKAETLLKNTNDAALVLEEAANILRDRISKMISDINALEIDLQILDFNEFLHNHFDPMVWNFICCLTMNETEYKKFI